MYERLILAYYGRKIRKLVGHPCSPAFYKMLLRFVITGKCELPKGWTIDDNTSKVFASIDESDPRYYPQLL